MCIVGWSQIISLKNKKGQKDLILNWKIGGGGVGKDRKLENW